jgi:hypothetical protein
MYFRAYVRAPGSRSWGFGVSVLPNLALLAGGIIGVIIALVRHS